MTPADIMETHRTIVAAAVCSHDATPALAYARDTCEKIAYARDAYARTPDAPIRIYDAPDAPMLPLEELIHDFLLDRAYVMFLVFLDLIDPYDWDSNTLHGIDYADRHKSECEAQLFEHTIAEYRGNLLQFLDNTAEWIYINYDAINECPD